MRLIMPKTSKIRAKNRESAKYLGNPKSTAQSGGIKKHGVKKHDQVCMGYYREILKYLQPPASPYLVRPGILAEIPACTPENCRYTNYTAAFTKILSTLKAAPRDYAKNALIFTDAQETPGFVGQEAYLTNFLCDCTNKGIRLHFVTYKLGKSDWLERIADKTGGRVFDFSTPEKIIRYFKLQTPQRLMLVLDASYSMYNYYYNHKSYFELAQQYCREIVTALRR